MIKQELKVRTLTPVWTGDAEGVPQGLKCSGIIGSMRMIFEAIIRGEAGGHTCDITGTQSNRRCNYSKNPNICPACAIFGCTGLSRAFKINWELPEIRNVLLPIADTREGDGKRNKRRIPISNWLASTVSADKEMGRKFSENDWIAKVRPAYSPEVSTIQILQMPRVERQRISIDVPVLIRGLLAFMALKYGIGAKVNLGWGAFAIADEEAPDMDHFKAELRKLIELYPYSKPFANGFLKASHINSIEIAKPFSIPFKISSRNNDRLMDNFGFSWSADPSEDQNFICLGYALKYRLRRMVKFAKRESPIGKLAAEWKREQEQKRSKQCKGEDKKKQVPSLAEYLFGAAAKTGNDQYGAGIIGVSHLYRLNENQDWSVRLLTQCPNDAYNKAISEFFSTIYATSKR